MKKLVYESVFPVFGNLFGAYMHQDMDFVMDLPRSFVDESELGYFVRITPLIIEYYKKEEPYYKSHLENLIKELDVLIPNFERYADEIVADSDWFSDKDVLLSWVENLHHYLKNEEPM